MSSRTSDLISPKANVGMIRRGADLIKREDENCQCELPSRRARQDGIENLIELAVIPDGPSPGRASPTNRGFASNGRRTALLVLGGSGACTTLRRTTSAR